MDSVLIDTDVLSYLFKRDSRGELYKPMLDRRLGVISFMTIAELNFWAHFRNWGAQRRGDLASFLEPYTLIDSDRQLSCVRIIARRLRRRRSRDAGRHASRKDRRCFSSNELERRRLSSPARRRRTRALARRT